MSHYYLSILAIAGMGWCSLGSTALAQARARKCEQYFFKTIRAKVKRDTYHQTTKPPSQLSRHGAVRETASEHQGRFWIWCKIAEGFRKKLQTRPKNEQLAWLCIPGLCALSLQMPGQMEMGCGLVQMQWDSKSHLWSRWIFTFQHHHSLEWPWKSMSMLQSTTCHHHHGWAWELQRHWSRPWLMNLSGLVVSLNWNLWNLSECFCPNLPSPIQSPTALQLVSWVTKTSPNSLSLPQWKS